MAKHEIPLLVTLSDLDGEEHEVEIIHESESDSGFVLALSLKKITAAAIEHLLTDHPDLQTFADEGGIVPVLFRKAGETSRYVVNAAYAGDGGPFGSDYEAVDAECATLQAFWQMACNEFDGRDADLDAMVNYIAKCKVFDSTLEPVPAHDRTRLFVDLVEALRGDGDVDDALAKAEEALVATGDIRPRLPANAP